MLVCFLLRAGAEAPEAEVPPSGTTLNCFTYWDHPKDWSYNSKILSSKIVNTHNFKTLTFLVLSTVIHSFYLEWFRKTLLCKSRCRQVNFLGLKQGWAEKILSCLSVSVQSQTDEFKICVTYPIWFYIGNEWRLALPCLASSRGFCLFMSLSAH